jgi:hypothetical protein
MSAEHSSETVGELVDLGDDKRVGHAFGTEWLMRVMATVGVETWEKVPGARLLVLYPKPGHWGLSPVGIANIDTGKALIFKELAAEFFPESTVS